MLVDYEYINNRLIVSYIDKTGKLQMGYYPWREPRQYKPTHDGDQFKHDRFRTWDGRPLTWYVPKVPNRYTTYDFIDALPETETEMLFEYNEPKIFFIDIETEVIDEFPDPVAAKTRVLAVSIVRGTVATMMGLKDLSAKELKTIEEKTNKRFEKLGYKFTITYEKYDSEFQLLNKLFNSYIPRMPVITGWNVVNYDWVYLVNRARKIGVEPSVASPTGKLERAWDKKTGYKDEELPKHRVVVDYMDLYKKWDTSVKIKDSASLDFVAEQILGIKKIEYDGTLQQLYNRDFETYMFYNLVDTILVMCIHEKMRYIDIMYNMSVLSRIRMTDAFSTIRTTEGILRRQMRSEMDILLVREYVEEEDKTEDDDLAGGYVKKPVRGMSEYTAVFDFESLYPRTQIQFRIAPETYKGIMKPEDHTKCLYNGIERNIDNTDVVLLNGTVFRNEETVTLKVLNNIFNQRRESKKKMLEAKDKLKALENTK